MQQHVLRFWETKFSQVKPLKRGGGRRYYRPEDINLLEAIHTLLYVEGYTIKGVQKLLREVGKRKIVESFSKEKREEKILTTISAKPESPNSRKKQALEDVLAELKELRGMIKSRN